jgi:hypothetical protein
VSNHLSGSILSQKKRFLTSARVRQTLLSLTNEHQRQVGNCRHMPCGPREEPLIGRVARRRVELAAVFEIDDHRRAAFVGVERVGFAGFEPRAIIVQWRPSRSRRGLPVFQSQSRHSAELAGIRGDEGQTGGKSMTCQEDVIGADHATLRFE